MSDHHDGPDIMSAQHGQYARRRATRRQNPLIHRLRQPRTMQDRSGIAGAHQGAADQPVHRARRTSSKPPARPPCCLKRRAPGRVSGRWRSSGQRFEVPLRGDRVAYQVQPHRQPTGAAGSGAFPRIISDAFSASMMTAAFVCAETRSGRPTHRRRAVPRCRARAAADRARNAHRCPCGTY